MKPPGITLKTSDGAVVFAVTRIDRVADKIWDAVDSAIEAGWTPAQFKSEVAEAWEHFLRERAKQAAKELR